MDSFGWSAGPLGGAGDDLNLLGGPLLEVDDKTLQCLVGSSTPWTFAALPDGEAGPSSVGAVVGIAASGNDGDAAAVPGPSGFGAKRARSEDEEDCEDEDGGSGSGDGGGVPASGACASGRRPIGRKGKPMTREAVAKSHREKARRERLNDGFEELARLCDPSGKMVKSDRVSIVQDAIRVLQSLRVENNQLRQLNKFLEERVGGYERARAQGLYQAAVAQQAALLQQQQVAAAAQPLAAAGVGAAAAAALPLAGSMPSAEIEACSSSAPLGAAAMAAAAPGPVPPGMMLVSLPVSAGAMQGVAPDAASAQALALKQAGLAEQQAALAGTGVPIALPASAPPVGWLPPSDVVRDGQLRPPAA